VIAATVLFDLPAVDASLTFVVMVMPAGAMTVAIVAPDIVSIEDLFGRTLVYGALSVAIVAIDLAVLAGLTTLLGDSLDQRQVVLLVLLLSAVIYAPLRQRIWRGVRRLLLGDRDNPYDAVAGLASTLETTDEGPGQLAVVARAVATAFGVSFVRVEVDRGGGEKLLATHGEQPAETRTLPITYRDVEVGRLVLPARGLRSRLSRRDEQLLGDLVRQAATAARTSRLADELQDSRERLVVAREEERRRIRRDLHDGLGPALSGVVFRLESARLLVDRDPDAARAHIAATSDHVQEVVADVRRLVHDLRPPALDDRGLVGALQQQAEELATDGLSVAVEADDLGPLPAAVEVAAYRIAGEGLTNVVRHAAARECVVRLAVDDGDLVVEVADDGTGIAPDAEAGVGLVSLRERASELGGRSEVTCPATGGTVVRAWLPLRRTA
jgi:signal transduction histidine kinase